MATDFPQVVRTSPSVAYNWTATDFPKVVDTSPSVAYNGTAILFNGRTSATNTSDISACGVKFEVEKVISMVLATLVNSFAVGLLNHVRKQTLSSRLYTLTLV